MTKILAFSDMHMSRRCAQALSAMAAEADLVIGAGDFCVKRQGLDEAMEMLRPVEGRAVYVPGNAESAGELRAATTATVLHGSEAELAGIVLFGIGYAVPRTPFGEWSCDLDEAEAEAMLAAMQRADILISHSPPKGVGDRTAAGASIGSTAVRAAIERAKPRLCHCGHVHDSWGVSGTIGITEVHNLGPTPRWLEI